jgi:hypothetical protein
MTIFLHWMKSILKHSYVFWIFLYAYVSSEEYPYKNSIEANIFVDNQRLIKLKDGSYWQVKINNGFFYTDKVGAKWYRHDQIKLQKGIDPLFPYLLENLNNHEVLSCKAFDPALSQKISVILLPSPSLPPVDTLTIFSIIRTYTNLFIKLNDTSYWEIKLENKWFFFQNKTSLSTWSRFDPIELKTSNDDEFPYLLINLINQEVFLCKQVDPAIPSSVHYYIYEDDNDVDFDDDDNDDD